MKDILNHLFQHKTLTKGQAQEILRNITQGLYNECQMASFFTVFSMRPITVEELSGFRETLLDLCMYVDLSNYETIDMCGTGGDNKNTFNISTLASFVVAGTGIKVAKHGNYAVSSGCGSSNVLEKLGYKFKTDVELIKEELEKANICFLHAPLFHPAMKNVGPVRRALGIKTFFNMLGPLINPSMARNQIVGVFNLELARLYKYLNQKIDRKFIIIHSVDGYDEISLTSPCKIISNTEDKLIYPSDFGFDYVKPQELMTGKNIDEAVQTFMSIISGKGTQSQNNVVIANASMGIKCMKPELKLSQCVEMASDSLFNKDALSKLELLL